jgi:molybdopterin synthase catalytic subunit
MVDFGSHLSVPVIRVLGRSGSGKTTFIGHLLQLLADRRVAVLKHTRHPLRDPAPDKDTGHHFAAGAAISVGLSPDRLELFARGDPWTLAEVCGLLAGKVDLILIEGSRETPVPTILLGETPENAILPPEGEILRLPAQPGWNDDLAAPLLAWLHQLLPDRGN